VTSASTLYWVRSWLFDLIEDVLPEDVAFGWDMPNEPADVDGPQGLRRSVWLRAEVEAKAEKAERTMPAGWNETWTQVVRIQCLPEDGSVDTPAADLAAAELLDAVVEEIEANKRPVIPEIGEWSTVVTYGGYRYRSGRLEGSDGYAASYEIDIDVEANRCS